MWLVLATAAELPPAVFSSLNLNYPFNLMFQTPALIVMSIGATRIHRSLTDYTNSDSKTFEIYSTRRGRKAITDLKPIFAARIPLNLVEVVLHKPSEDYPPTRVGLGGVDSQSQDKSLVLDISNDLENGVKRG
jgi:hypothetical protein